MFRILLTRPLDQSQGFRDALVGEGVPEDDIAVAPIMQIQPKPGWLISKDAVLVFTSANAVRSAVHLADGRKAVCVGKSTTQLACGFGFDAQFGGIDVAALKIHLLSMAAPLCHLHGEHVTGDLVGYLQANGKDAAGIVTYTQPALALPDWAVRHLEGGTPVILPLFSPRSATLVTQQKVNWSKHSAVAISPAVADVCNAAGFGQVITAQTPQAATMMQVTIREYNRLLG